MKRGSLYTLVVHIFTNINEIKKTPLNLIPRQTIQLFIGNAKYFALSEHPSVCVFRGVYAMLFQS